MEDDLQRLKSNKKYDKTKNKMKILNKKNSFYMDQLLFKKEKLLLN